MEAIINETLVDQVLASVVETAAKEGVDSHALIAKLHDRSLNELKSCEEPARKKQKLGNDEKEVVTNEAQKSSSRSEATLDIFLLHGLKFLSLDDLFPSFADSNRDCQLGAMRELARRCKDRHPSLYAAATTLDENGQALLSWDQWRKFEIGEHLSDGSRFWPFQASDVTGDIDVLLEVTKGDAVVWHGVSPIVESDDDFRAIFHLPHWTFDAPLPSERDVFFIPPLVEGVFPERRIYYFWAMGSDRSVQQKTLCKALYGAHYYTFLEQTMPPIHVHIVLRRRSTGQMVTMISKSCPYDVYGEDYPHEVGNYSVIFNSDHLEYERLSPEFEFPLFCARSLDEGADSVSFSTSKAERDGTKPSDNLNAVFRFADSERSDDESDDGSVDKSDDGSVDKSNKEIIVDAMRQYFREA